MTCLNCKKECTTTELTAEEATEVSNGHALYFDPVVISNCCYYNVEETEEENK